MHGCAIPYIIKAMRVCYFCGNPLGETVQIFRSSTCPSCSKDLKICYNCKFFSESAHWKCLETLYEPVAEKDRSNFCDYFTFKDTTENEDRMKKGFKGKKTKEAFEKLFGNG